MFLTFTHWFALLIYLFAMRKTIQVVGLLILLVAVADAEIVSANKTDTAQGGSTTVAPSGKEDTKTEAPSGGEDTKTEAALAESTTKTKLGRMEDSIMAALIAIGAVFI
ncbi:unnamed protein product [Cylicostephanus goldi]|uniref:Uncharacterized protein n=1 Tax=Cylicostephanus goldi TaxID=71465 RepID=A0A3P6RD92_CYLGO|nr:unnamed protein product [Cylicostephanus goldi]